MQSKARTVAEYLASLPADRRASVEAVRAVILKNLDKDYREGMQYGMIGYYVPHEIFGPGYHCDPRQPLPFAALGSQKNYLSLHCMCAYGDGPTKQWLERAWKAAGKKLDMGKACIRFKSADDVPLDVIGELIGRMPAKKWVEIYVNLLASMGKGPDGKPIRKVGGEKGKGGAPQKTLRAKKAAKARSVRGGKR